MEKHTELLLKQLESKDWDMVVLYVKGKGQPVLIEKDVKFSILDQTGIPFLQLEAVVPHPAPQSQADVQRQFTMTGHVVLSEILAADFFTEKRIQGAPVGGTGVISMTR